MDVEQLEERAQVHAALADPARLRIADHLVEGDATPGELRALLSMSSNLLAHHLRVLEEAGVVERRRSEADRRRSYVRLLPPRWDRRGDPVREVPRVLFVCTANSARSQLAVALWSAASDVPVASAGTHPAPRVAPGARRVARRHGLALLDGPPRRLDEVARPADYLVSVCDRAHEELGDAVAHTHWSVPDPVAAGTARAFEAAHDELASRVVQLAPRLIRSAPA